MIKPLLPAVNEKRSKGFSVKKNRVRKDLPNRLPIQGMLPFPIDEHEHIGEYESKHNLYLTMAHAYNACIARVEELEEKLERNGIL